MAGLGSAFLADDDPLAQPTMAELASGAPTESLRPVERPEQTAAPVSSVRPVERPEKEAASGFLNKELGGESLTIDGSAVTVRDVLFGKGTTNDTGPVSMKDILFGKMPPKDDDAAAEVDPKNATYSTSGGQSKAGKVDGGYIKDGLMRRGLPEHIAEAMVWNMQDESGLDAGINEISPTVEGSRGGFGLYQLTGPRRVAYEKMADQRGVGYNDVDAQLDFLVNELQTTEKGAYELMMATDNPQEAADVIVRKFLRPAEEHREARSAKYLRGGMSTPTATETMSVQPTKLWLDV